MAWALWTSAVLACVVMVLCLSLSWTTAVSGVDDEPWMAWTYLPSPYTTTRHHPDQQADSLTNHDADFGPSLPCNHPVYCFGPVLTQWCVPTGRHIWCMLVLSTQGVHRQQFSGIFTDSKTFVDMPCAKPVQDVLRAFALLPQPPSQQDLVSFLEENFYEAGSEMQAWTPPDWRDDPLFLELIADLNLKRFAADIHSRWRNLGRVFNRTSACSNCYSSFDLPFPFIVPGGRFREAYYWDSLWVMDGILVSNMTATAQHLLKNFDYMVRKYGFVPNGGRIYYEARSQPPVYALMAKKYYEYTGDLEFIISLLPSLYAEYNFWMTYRAVEVQRAGGPVHTLNIYSVDTNVPRPESYVEDIKLAEGLTPSEAQLLFSELASGAETGWDYSSRWFADKSHFDTIQTRRIVPVDLNSILFVAETFLADAARLAGDISQSSHFVAQAAARRQAIHQVLWDETTSQWRDYNIITGEHVSGFYPSNFFPVWADALDDSQQNENTRSQIFEALLPQLSYVCGVPTSDFVHSNPQQWDYPNSWPPVQQILVRTLEKLGLPEATAKAADLVRTWLECNYCGWAATGAENGGSIFEKYDATRRGAPGYGGEYGVQEGFGWTNGVILRFAVDYGQTLEMMSCDIK